MDHWAQGGPRREAPFEVTASIPCWKVKRLWRDAKQAHMFNNQNRDIETLKITIKTLKTATRMNKSTTRMQNIHKDTQNYCRGV